MLQKVVARLIVLLAILPAGCSVLSHEAPPEDIDKAAALFFQRLGNGEYDTIYNDSSTLFQERQTRQNLVESLRQMVEQCKVVNFERVSMSFQQEGTNRMASPVYRVTSDRSRGETTLIFHDQGGEWKFFGFAFKPRV
jgi:hypothetical protein